MQGKDGDNIVNLPLYLDYHTVVIFKAFKTLLLLFLYNLKYYKNCDSKTLV